MISGNKSVTKRAFYCIWVGFLGAKVTILFGMAKQKSNFLLFPIWSLPTSCSIHLEPQHRQTDAGSNTPSGNIHRYFTAIIADNGCSLPTIHHARTTPPEQSGCSIHLGAIEQQSQTDAGNTTHTIM